VASVTPYNRVTSHLPRGPDLKCDQMTSQERWDAFIAREPVDRVPCLQFILGHTAVVNGKPIAKIYDDAAESLACQKNAMALYGHDGLIMHGWANAGGAEFGGEIEFPYRKYTGAPMMKKNPVQSEEDAWNLKVPDDILTAGTMPVALEFSRLQYEAGMMVTLQVGSPLTWAGSVCGEERLMIWLLKKPDLVHHVLRVITDFIKQKSDHWIERFGAERLMAFDLCIETNKLYSPKQFETFGFPYLREIHDHLTRQGTAIVLSHICGEQNKNLPLWSQLSYGKRGMVSVGKEVAIARARELFPDLIVMGNVDPVTVQEGTPEQVRALSKECIEAGRDHPGGYALMTGCEVPPQAPPVNVGQMVVACRDFGQY
jgi:uroporphyrinogen decarboxylase